jgi:hypothetical protein
LKSGAEFPPVKVAIYKGEHILMDGRHRIESKKAVKERYIQAEIHKGLTKKQIYLEAVKNNIVHGRQFSTQEVVGICITLEKWNMSQEQISEIVRIPTDQIKPFVAKRSVSIFGEGDVALKGSLRHLAGETTDMTLKEKQKLLTPARNQVTLINNMIILLKNDWINRDDKEIAKKLEKLYKLLSAFI